MNNYLKNYDSLTKKIVFKFGIGNGGIGDLTKFFTYLLQLCITHKIKLHYLLMNNPVDKFLKLNFEKMYITNENIINPVNINDINEITNIQPDVFYTISPCTFYNVINIYEEINIPLQKIFYFTDEIILSANNFINTTNYISIHLRLGDKYLETDKQYVLCILDTRDYNEENLFKFIEQNSTKNILFFCDNNKYKLKIKDKYNFVNITNYDIGHTSLSNTTDLQFFNTVQEFYLLSNSEHIYKASYSGFSIMASKFKNIPILDI